MCVLQSTVTWARSLQCMCSSLGVACVAISCAVGQEPSVYVCVCVERGRCGVCCSLL